MLFVGALAVCTVAEFVTTPVPVVMTVGNAAFGVMLLVALARGLRFGRPAVRDAETDRLLRLMSRPTVAAGLNPLARVVETFVASYKYRGELVRKVLPRNDLLVRGADPGWLLAKKEELGLPTDRLLVLYNGEIVASFAHADQVSEEELGLYMLGLKRQAPSEAVAV